MAIKLRQFVVVALLVLVASACDRGPTQPSFTGARVVSFSAEPNPAPWKGTTTLNWVCENATGVSIPGVLENGPATGSVQTPALNESQIFTATCVGPQGPGGSMPVSVIVVPRINGYSVTFSTSEPLKEGDSVEMSASGQCAVEGLFMFYLYRDDGAIQGIGGRGCGAGGMVQTTIYGSVDSDLPFCRGHAVTFRVVFTDMARPRVNIIATPDLPSGYPGGWVTVRCAP